MENDYTNVYREYYIKSQEYAHAIRDSIYHSLISLFNKKFSLNSCSAVCFDSMVARYRRVSQTENNEGDEMKKKRADRIERITSKIHALIWIVASVILLIYTDLFKIALNDDRVNRYWKYHNLIDQKASTNT